jgi:hypothetical protein
MTNLRVLPPLCLLLGSIVNSCSEPAPGAPADERLVLVESESPDAYKLSGTITFSSTLPTGTEVVLELSDASHGTTNLTLESVQSFQEHALTRPTTSIPYEVLLLQGKYLISAYVDLNHDAALNEQDMAGYYASLATTAVSQASDATVIEVTTQSVANLDFSLGPIQCLAKIGEQCSTDEDCRPTRCSSSLVLPGRCDDSAHVCALSECAAGNPEETSCLGN